MPRTRSHKKQPPAEPTADLNLPNSWLARFARRIIRARNTKAAVRRIMHNPDNPAFVSMFKELTRRGYGDVPRDMNVNAKLSLADLVAPKDKPDLASGAAPSRLLAGAQSRAEGSQGHVGEGS
jgi:hypothetical protein